MTLTNNEPIKFDVLSGLAYYAFLHQPDRGNKEHNIGPRYKIDLVLDEGSLVRAKEQGLKIKPATEKVPGAYVSIVSKVDPKFPDRKPPKIMDAKRNTIPPSVLVGNGSEVRVRYLPYVYQGNKTTPILKEVMVTKLVEYKPTEAEIARKGTYLNETDGYTVSTEI